MPPLVIITTNEERVLPDAFVRRCLVLHLSLPEKRKDLIDHLVERGRAHFHKAGTELLNRAAELLVDDRSKAVEEHWLPLPGQAEYLDLVRAVLELAGKRKEAPGEILKRIAGYVLKKHPDAIRRRREESGQAVRGDVP